MSCACKWMKKVRRVAKGERERERSSEQTRDQSAEQERTEGLLDRENAAVDGGRGDMDLPLRQWRVLGDPDQEAPRHGLPLLRAVVLERHLFGNCIHPLVPGIVLRCASASERDKGREGGEREAKEGREKGKAGRG
eukprot:1952933-Rhodomonas_salina.1